MTIKELESRTGMTRANIRFYEGEGLLSPKRLDNGYRDYSEEDARTLEKIKLLRQLQLDIDTIRKVQQGTLTLEQALFTQTTRLEGDKAVIERAAQVCRELERSGVEYADLEPQPWLGRLQGPAHPGLPEPPAVPAEDERDDEPRACYHPWQRYFARSLDILLYNAVINVAWMLLSRDVSFAYFQNSNVIVQWFFELLALAFALALEPFWLHYWGWTPGKWVFGLKLRYEDGDKLSLSDARGRCWGVFTGGYGWNIPFWNLWKMWQGRKLGLDGRDCAWDDDEGYRYTKEERRIGGGWIYVAANIACIAALVLSMLWCCVPPCRGDLTVAEFARNYNHSLGVQQAAGSGTYEPTLDDQGQWVKQEQSGVVIDISGESTVYDQPEFTVADGRVTAVRLHMRSDSIMVSSGFRETLALMALVRSADGVNLFSVTSALNEAAVLLSKWEELETDLRGLHISQQVEYDGYHYLPETGSLLWVEDAQTPHSCEKTVTISLIE